MLEMTVPYRKMPHRRRTTQRKRGGAAYTLVGAPLDYVMTPGSTYTTDPSVGVYSRFPIDPTVNPQVVSDLDVFFNSGLSQGCGTENSTLTVPADMGSNQIVSMQGGAAIDTGNPFLNSISGMGESATNHPYLASAYPNTAQSLTHSWQGKLDSVPTSSDPTDHTWKLATDASLKAYDVGNLARSLGTATALLSPSVAVTGGARRTKSKRTMKRKSPKSRKSRKARRTRQRK